MESPHEMILSRQEEGVRSGRISSIATFAITSTFWKHSAEIVERIKPSLRSVQSNRCVAIHFTVRGLHFALQLPAHGFESVQKLKKISERKALPWHRHGHGIGMA